MSIGSAAGTARDGVLDGSPPPQVVRRAIFCACSRARGQSDAADLRAEEEESAALSEGCRGAVPGGTSLTLPHLSSTAQQRALLAIINPHGSKGVALWTSRVRPILSVCPHIEIKEVITSRSREATELAAEADLAVCDGIVAVGGDGILYEIISGLLQRADWEAAIKLPLGIVPAGSGNGLALSILHSAGETWDPESMAYLIARGGTRPLDLVSMDSPSIEQTFSFLSTEWALASDIDITSEKYRCCGSFRFTCRALELVYCDGCVRDYTGSLHYLPVDAGGEGESKYSSHSM